MFPDRYYPGSYFAPRYFPRGGITDVATDVGGVFVESRRGNVFIERERGNVFAEERRPNEFRGRR